MVAGGEGSPVFDMTSLDFEGVERDLIRFAQQKFTAEVWSDFNESDEGRRFIELLAYATDLIAYTENAHALETLVSSLVREQNFRNIAKSFDFGLKSAAPSRTTLQFTLDESFLPLVIPANYRVADEKTGEIIFQPDVEGIASTTTYTVQATQGKGIENEILGASNGLASQEYQLGESPVIDGTLAVFVNGTNFKIIKNFVEAGPSDQVCLIETNEQLETFIFFGDGINGLIPPLGLEITASYKVGGGIGVNLPKNTITNPLTTLAGVLEVTNINAAQGGGPRQSLLTAKRLLPLMIKSNERCVTLEDYATTAAALVPGVLKARAVSGLFQAGGNPVLLFVVPNGGGDVPSSLTNLIVTTLRYGTSTDTGRSLAGRRVFVRTAVYVDLLITVDAHVNKGSVASQVGARVKRAYAARYQLESNDFGTEVDLQDAYNTVDPKERNIGGLSRVFLRRFSVKPYCGRYVTKPSTGNGTAYGISTNTNTKRREWNIRIIVGGRFYVYQRILGTISTVSDTSLTDEQAIYSLDELVTADNGYRLRVREQEQNESFAIVSNTDSVITIAGNSSPGGISNLLVLATDKDSYAVERQEALIGKILFTVVTGSVSVNATVVPVVSSAGFSEDDKVLVRRVSGEEHISEVASVTGSSITLKSEIPFALEAGDTVDWYWTSEDGTCGFALVQGSVLFTAGDELYVDTYALTGDVQLRPENYPILKSENLVVNPVGGIR